MTTTADSIGRVLAGRYRIEAPLGTGASAHVFAAHDTALKRRVAVKVLHPALAGDANFLRRFRAEAQAAAALTHPHVLSVFDWGEDDAAPFLVLEYLGGGSLRDLLDSGRRLTVAQAVAVGVQGAQGLAYAHGRGFVHRDVKPANLLFDEEGRLSIADFGLARALSEAAWTEPAGATVGTARYAAPEQAKGQAVGGRADVYSLALVLYEAVTGTVPFVSDTTIGTLMARVGARLPAHESLGPLGGILAPAAAPEPADRIDASALAARLQTLAAQLPDPTPLPLAGAGGRGMSLGGRAGDATELGVRPAPGGRSDDSDVLAVADAVGVTGVLPPGPAGRAPGMLAGGPPAPVLARRKRRRWPWLVAIVAVVVALVVAAVLTAVQTGLFTPSHPLPAVTGLTVARADARLRSDHLSVQVTGHRSSMTVPSGSIVRQIPASGTSLKQGTVVSVVVSTGPPPVAVPDLTQVTGGCSGAAALLTSATLKLGSCRSRTSTQVGAGGIISYRPTGQAPEGSPVDVVVSSGPPMVTVPSLAGISTCAGVASTMSAAGLQASCTTRFDTSAAGTILSVSASGSVPQGSTVTVAISKGEPTVPSDLAGKSAGQAAAELQAAGLALGQVYGPSGGTVFAVDPGAGTAEPPGTPVNLYVL